MPTDVYITRAVHHFDGAQVPIAQDDWRAIIENDPGLQSPDAAHPSYGVWVGPARSGPHWIDWANGNLFTRRPDASMLRKLLELAELLGASVQNHRGGQYELDADGRVLEPEPESDISPAAGPPGLVAFDTRASRARTEKPMRPGTGKGAAAVSGERFFGPRPRNVDASLGPVGDGADQHPDASFARRPEEVMLSADPEEPPPAEITFQVGQRVRTDWGRPATVVSIDCGDGGIGKIEVRYDDGRVASLDCPSHGLEPLIE